jgi:hypothetical protein
MRWGAIPLGVALLAVGIDGAARGADLTDLASSFEEKHVFDFRFRFRYDHMEKRAQVKRELEGLSPDQEAIALFKDLVYQQQRDTLTLRAEMGLYQDFMLHVELPIIYSEQATYAFDTSAGAGCTYPPTTDPTCVNAVNSSTIADGIVPPGGFDATRNGAPLPPGGDLFRGVSRGAHGGSGADAFDTFNLGLTWAPVNQRRDDTKPTWILGAEAQFSIGNIKQLDRAHPDANHGVSDGVHRLLFRTAVSKRIGRVDPYVEFWYLLPIPREGSLFRDYGPAQKTKNPQQQGGTKFGFETIAYERPDKGYKVAVDLRGRIEGHFAGRGYSEIWELLASAPALQCDTAYNRACDPTVAMKNPYQGQPFTGITTIENYATLGADVAVTAQVTRYAHLRLGFDYTHDQSHLITGDDIGTPNNPTGRVIAPDEFNPAYRPIVDAIGRRYRIDNVNQYNVYLWGQVMF